MKFHVSMVLMIFVAVTSMGASYYRAPGGAEVCGKTLQSGESCYARLTAADAVTEINAGNCLRGAKLRLVCNIANSADFDCSVTIKECPAGVTSGAQCQQVLSPLTGAPNFSVMYGVQAQNLVSSGTVGASQTAELEISCF
jgi:hypothetical protein